MKYPLIKKQSECKSEIKCRINARLKVIDFEL